MIVKMLSTLLGVALLPTTAPAVTTAAQFKYTFKHKKMFRGYEVNKNNEVVNQILFFFTFSKKTSQVPAQVKESSQFKKMLKSGLVGWYK